MWVNAINPYIHMSKNQLYVWLHTNGLVDIVALIFVEIPFTAAKLTSKEFQRNSQNLGTLNSSYSIDREVISKHRHISFSKGQNCENKEP